MHESINRVNKIITALSLQKIGRPFFSDKRYTAFDFDKNNFHHVSKSQMQICFIDGGNASIIEAQNFELSIIRTYFCTYKATEKTSFSREDFYLAVSPTIEEDKLVYNAELIPTNSENSTKFSFVASDDTLKNGKFDAEIGTIAGIVRRFAEWKTAERLANSMDSGMIVMDGSLQTGYTGENFYAESAYNSANNSGIVLSGLSKTSSLLTTTGMNLMAAIDKISPKAPWYYYPIAEISHPDHFAEMFALKLHENARICYRYEILKSQAKNADNTISLQAQEAISALAFNARDPRYLGYPYGLIDADNFARITERERLALRTLFSSHAQKLSESAGDAHEIINRIVS